MITRQAVAVIVNAAAVTTIHARIQRLRETRTAHTAPPAAMLATRAVAHQTNCTRASGD
jgi:hypothetical protein